MKKATTIIMTAALTVGSCMMGTGMNVYAADDLNFVIIPKCVHEWFDAVNQGRSHRQIHSVNSLERM